MHPDLADDTEATIAQALQLWGTLGLRNVMIKVPATVAGVPAIEELTARGVNVNVTLLFSVERYEQVIDAYLAGLERRAAAGEPPAGVASVASFFVSRVDAEADARLPGDSPLRGKVASPTLTVPTAATWRGSPDSDGMPCGAKGRRHSVRCGRVPVRKIRTTPTCFMSRS